MWVLNYWSLITYKSVKVYDIKFKVVLETVLLAISAAFLIAKASSWKILQFFGSVKGHHFISHFWSVFVVVVSFTDGSPFTFFKRELKPSLPDKAWGYVVYFIHQPPHIFIYGVWTWTDFVNISLVVKKHLISIKYLS